MEGRPSCSRGAATPFVRRPCAARCAPLPYGAAPLRRLLCCSCRRPALRGGSAWSVRPPLHLQLYTLQLYTPTTTQHTFTIVFVSQRLRRSATARKVVRAWDYAHATRKKPCVRACGAAKQPCKGVGGGRPWPRPRVCSPFVRRPCAARCASPPVGRSAASLAALLVSPPCSSFAVPPVRPPLRVTAAAPQLPTMASERLSPYPTCRRLVADLSELVETCRKI